MRASIVLGGAGTISGIASTTCGGDHVRVRRACLRCPHALLPCTALLSKRIKGDSFACAAGRGSAQSHRRRGRPKIGHARRWFNRDSQSSNALSANGSRGANSRQDCRLQLRARCSEALPTSMTKVSAPTSGGGLTDISCARRAGTRLFQCNGIAMITAVLPMPPVVRQANLRHLYLLVCPMVPRNVGPPP